MLDLKRFSAFNSFDDNLVASILWNEHMGHLLGVLSSLEEFGLTVCPSKVFAGFIKLEFLDHILGEGGIHPEKSKVKKKFRGRNTHK